MSLGSSPEVEELRLRVAELERELARARAAPAHGTALGARGLAEHEALPDEAERAAQMGTWVWDLLQNTVVWSRQLFRILGYDPERDAASVDAYFAAVHPEDRERVRTASLRTRETGDASSPFLHRVLHRDGAVRDCLTCGIPIYDGSGGLVRIVGALVDLTARHRAERELYRSGRMLKEAQRIAHVGSWFYDIVTQSISWSDELYRIFGVDRAVRPSFELFCRLVHPEDRRRVFGGAESASPLGVASPVECRVVRPCDGEVRHVQMASELFTDEQGSLLGLVGTSLDITERRRLEEQLLHSQKLEAMGRLAGGVAHDFNNMLTAIFGNTELASRKVPPESPASEHLAQVRIAAERAAALTRQLLAFARKQIIQPAVFDPNALLLDMEPLLRPMVGEDIAISLLPGAEVWSIRIDRGQFEHLIINLAVNARDAMPAGGCLTIDTSNLSVDVGGMERRPHLAPGDYVELVVTDTGHGMDESIQRHVFEPFFTTKEVGKGSGLGLAICHGIVEQHGGHIWFHSAPGRGTSFRICFPREHAVLGEPEIGAPATVIGGGETVLFVEDEAQVREIGVRSLRGFGYTVLPARSGKEAIALAAAHPGAIHLLVSDVVLPDVRGPELAAAFRRGRAAMPVLYSSGYAEEAIARHGVLEPGVSFLEKPYTPMQLAQAVRRALDAVGPSHRPAVPAEPAAAGRQP